MPSIGTPAQSSFGVVGWAKTDCKYLANSYRLYIFRRIHIIIVTRAKGFCEEYKQDTHFRALPNQKFVKNETSICRQLVNSTFEIKIKYLTRSDLLNR